MSEVKKNIGIVVALSIILAGGFFLFSEKSANTNAKPEGDDTSLLVPAPDAKPGQEEMIVTEDALMSETVPAEATVVTFTENGYSPTSITIKKGEAVRFDNRSNRDTWPASAFHPTHTIYPEKTSGDCLGSAFDACRGVPPGESWAFTFNHVGTWRYHDHLNASKTGSIIVTE